MSARPNYVDEENESYQWFCCFRCGHRFISACYHELCHECRAKDMARKVQQVAISDIREANK